jgi:hypothetical protein
MRVMFFGIGIAIMATLLLYIVGALLPATREVAVETEVNAPIRHVWSVMTAWADQPKWRKGITQVEVSSPDRFLEYPKRGGPISFLVLSRKEPQRIELGMSGTVNGRYLAELSELNGMTKIKAIEHITTNNRFLRVMAALFFDLRAFADQYLLELKTYAERHS